MSILDIIILVFIAVGAVTGLRRGLLSQLAGIVGLVVGLLVARAMYIPLASRFVGETGADMTVASIISFLLIWILVPIVLSLLATLLGKALDAVGLGFLNRLSGALFGALKMTLICGLIFMAIDYLDTGHVVITKKAVAGSSVYPYVTGTLEWFKNLF